MQKMGGGPKLGAEDGDVSKVKIGPVSSDTKSGVGLNDDFSRGDLSSDAADTYNDQVL
jgi:hypothetical protein